MATPISAFHPFGQEQFDKIQTRKDPSFYTNPGYQAWVSVASARSPGLFLYSNMWAKGSYTGYKYNYGPVPDDGWLGKTWQAGIPNPVSGNTTGNKPAPIVTSLEVEEGINNTLTRRATFTIVAHSSAQASDLIKYFLEPGYSVFLQWGWSTAAAGGQIIEPPVDPATIAGYQWPEGADIKRKAGGWEYDNYVGMVVGGNVEQDGDKWNINVKCNGLSELTLYKPGASVVYDRDGAGSRTDGVTFTQAEITDPATSLNKARFMMMFNELPSNRRTDRIKKDLLNTFEMLDSANYINFDPTVLETLNDKTSFNFLHTLGVNFTAYQSAFTAITGNNLVGTAIGGAVSLYQTIKQSFENYTNINVGNNGTSGQVAVESGVQLAGVDRYIRFGSAVTILNSIGTDGIELANGEKLSYKINIGGTSGQTGTVISAFKKMFSTKREYLFIPNRYSPKVSLRYAITNTTEQTNFSGERDNRVRSGGVLSALDNVHRDYVKFPQENANSYLPVGSNRDTKNINRASHTWGYLQDLYINFDFFKQTLEQPNVSIKDMLYQLLNGMSDAANGLWDFQIHQFKNGNVTEITVEDVNLLHVGGTPTIPTFDISGKNSPFIETSFSMDMSGKLISKIVAERVGGRPDNTGTTPSSLPGTRVPDLLVTNMTVDAQTTSNVNEDLSGLTADEITQKKAENLARFLQKAAIVPNPSFMKQDVELESDFDKCILVAAYDDMALFEALKVGAEKVDIDNKSFVGVLTNIQFSFTVHGISGITRGAMFKINGSPYGYVTEGFFQVTNVKHSVVNNQWRTEITGGFRATKSI